MQSNQKIDRIPRLRSDGHVSNGCCFYLWFCGMARAALLAIVFAGTVVFTTGCSSTEGGAKARLIVPDAQPGIVAKDDGGYEPARSPAFSELTGG